MCSDPSLEPRQHGDCCAESANLGVRRAANVPKAAGRIGTGARDQALPAGEVWLEFSGADVDI